MFESIRKHSKVVMIVLFLLIIPSFVLVGIDRNYFTSKSTVVARVDGHDITQDDWDNAHRMETDRIRAQSPSVDARLLDSPRARYATLERLVRDRVMQAAAVKMHLVTSDAQLARTLQGIPAIAALKRPDGSLDAEAYRALVGSQGLTPEGFENNVRRELSLSQVMGGVMGSAFAAQEPARLALDALYQRREIRMARFDAKDFAAKVTPTDDELQAHYKAHEAQFSQPEHADVQYVVLDLDAVRASITLSEDDLRSYYKENLERLSGKEERRASHILINAPKDAPAADREKARARAQALLEQVRKAPGTFAEVARKNSQDTGSAPSGGDLGFFKRGDMVKPFEDAAFSMKKGDISDLVESEYGYHIIQLNDVKTPKQPTFEESRAKLETEAKQQQAQRKYAELAEVFSNTVYEQADSLQPVADKLKLKVQTASDVTRTPRPGAQGPLANGRFLEALFASDSVQNKRNTEAIETAPSTLVAGRIATYTPASTPAFDQVKARVRELFVAGRSAELARKEGEARLAAWKAAPASATGLGAPVTVSRDKPEGQPRPVVDAALQVNADTLPAFAGTALGAQGYAVIKVDRIVPRDPSDPVVARQQQQQYGEAEAQAEAMAYYELLKDRFKVQFKVTRPTGDGTPAAEN
ncbi:SurA N-terminal domain-containing protein [Paracidovorax cattleyae]|uniref:Periplasmic chaperone PpiD n=1 Tax=Paracidovorax cattleyae TaxID=80868 RepID=A0A1H0WF77_9BURK|nr:SurA N-terminal domain-containing protein [Paracidovorax cattleyae]AVS73913.1 peptidylprolyl isomerase [Paracidovorax cattleyae]SDP89317.1 peptidyl-prolyl cis-trans isomerase D [Paracidovorax cattleyae]